MGGSATPQTVLWIRQATHWYWVNRTVYSYEGIAPVERLMMTRHFHEAWDFALALMAGNDWKLIGIPTKADPYCWFMNHQQVVDYLSQPHSKYHAYSFQEITTEL